jgi:hypothetical protein
MNLITYLIKTSASIFAGKLVQSEAFRQFVRNTTRTVTQLLGRNPGLSEVKKTFQNQSAKITKDPSTNQKTKPIIEEEMKITESQYNPGDKSTPFDAFKQTLRYNIMVWSRKWKGK